MAASNQCLQITKRKWVIGYLINITFLHKMGNKWEKLVQSQWVVILILLSQNKVLVLLNKASKNKDH